MDNLQQYKQRYARRQARRRVLFIAGVITALVWFFGSVFIGVALFTRDDEDETQYGVLAREEVLLSAPAEDASGLVILPPATIVTILASDDETGGWVQVTVNDDLEGWLPSAAVLLSDAQADAEQTATALVP